MKTLVSIPSLRREMAQLRKEIGVVRATAQAYIEEGCADMAEWHFKRMEIMEDGLKWRASAIRREQSNRKGVQNGKARL